MIENSSAGLVMLGDEVAITVTGEEHHQAVLARYPVAAGRQRLVAVELGWCTIGSGKYRGQPAIEVRLDGHRVGELTHLMSQRYTPLVSQVTGRGGRPGCVAVIQRGAKGLEVVLRLPRATNGVLPMPQPSVTTQTVPAPPVPSQRRGVFSSHRPVWIGAAVIVVLLIVAVANQDDSSPSTTSASQRSTSTALPTTETVPTTTSATSTSATTTTTPAPAPPPAPATSRPPAPRTTTRVAPPPAPPKPQPKPTCDPNYSGCVPVASDVDCLGGSGNGPAYVAGPITVIGTDIYDLDRDGDGIACE